jgi:hypothetical protein
MNRNSYAIGAAALATLVLASCDGSDGASGSAGTSSSTASSTSSFDTANVWAQALQKSETTQPYPVNNGAVVFSDTSDASQPISLTGP